MRWWQGSDSPWPLAEQKWYTPWRTGIGWWYIVSAFIVGGLLPLPIFILLFG